MIGGDNKPDTKILYGSVFDDILHKIASKRELFFQGQRIQIFRDFPKKLVEPEWLSPQSGDCFRISPESGLGSHIQLNYR